MANNVVQVKRTSVSGRTPNTTNAGNTQYINAGELALNMPDGILYTSNGSELITVGANLVNQNISGNLTVNGIIASGSLGNDGDVLATNGSVVYWASVGGTGTVTSVDSANGIAGGPITGSGTLYAVAGNSTVFVNASGIHVNTSALPTSGGGVNVDSQYVWTNTQTFQNTITFSSTINGTANNASFLGGVAAASYVNTSGNYTLTGNLSLSGTNNYFSTLTQFNAGIWRSTASGPSYWLQQDGTGRVHWYWGTAGGVSPTYATAGEDASAVTLSVSNAGAGGSFFHRSASGVGKIAGDALTWTTTLYTDLNTLSWKGTAIAVANGSTYNLVANNSTNLGGKTEGNLNVNNALVVRSTDNRAVTTTPETAAAPGLRADFKENTAEGLSDGGSFFGELTFRPYGSGNDWSGGPSHQLAFTTNNNIYFRSGNSTTWNSWKKIVDANTNTTFAGIPTFNANVVLGAGLSANGGFGTAGQVLTSNGTTGSPYWAAAAGGGYYKGGSATVGTLAVGGQNLFRVNANTLNFNTTIAAGENAQATGPIAVAAGITLTVASGARVAIV